jgi:hypothetical protein
LIPTLVLPTNVPAVDCLPGSTSQGFLGGKADSVVGQRHVYQHHHQQQYRPVSAWAWQLPSWPATCLALRPSPPQAQHQDVWCRFLGEQRGATLAAALPPCAAAQPGSMLVCMSMPACACAARPPTWAASQHGHKHQRHATAGSNKGLYVDPSGAGDVGLVPRCRPILKTPAKGDPHTRRTSVAPDSPPYTAHEGLCHQLIPAQPDSCHPSGAPLSQSLESLQSRGTVTRPLDPQQHHNRWLRHSSFRLGTLYRLGTRCKGYAAISQVRPPRLYTAALIST